MRVALTNVGTVWSLVIIALVCAANTRVPDIVLVLAAHHTGSSQAVAGDTLYGGDIIQMRCQNVQALKK